jgi:DNA ligase (NAD+)
VGKTVAEDVVKHMASLSALAAADQDDLESIEGVGPTIAESIVDWFEVEENRRLVRELRAEGVNTERLPEEEPADRAHQPLKGRTVVITGSLPDRTRREASQALEAAGASVTSSVSGNTDILVVGANPGSKLQTAAEEGAAIIRIEAPEDFDALLEDGIPTPVEE